MWPRPRTRTLILDASFHRALVEREILTRRLRWSGFIIFDQIAEFEAAATRLTEFALDGKIVHDEEILPGLEHAPGAIAQLYRGDNHGKLIIAVD